MKYGLWALLLLAASPLAAHAAGFAKESLFLSKTPVTEGDTVLIHAVVANENAEKFAGKVVFKEGEDALGTVAVAIAPGGANTVSLSWKPASGSHTIAAELTGDDGTVVEKESARFDIREKPLPASEAEQSGAVESSDDIRNTIGQYSPAAANASEPVFEAVDSLREKAADALDSGIEWAKTKTAPPAGEVLGGTTDTPSQKGLMDTLWFALATAGLYVFTILRFIVGSAGVFYPVLAIAFLYVLWRAYRRFRRPSY